MRIFSVGLGVERTELHQNLTSPWLDCALTLFFFTPNKTGIKIFSPKHIKFMASYNISYFLDIFKKLL